MGYNAHFFQELESFDFPLKKILDVGAQDVTLRDVEELDLLNGFVLKFKPDAEPFSFTDFPIMFEGREVYERAGFSYTSIDVDERPCVMRVDLSRFEIPKQRHEYDLVVNAGTTEHLASPVSAYALMHEMCAEGGLIYNHVPIFGMGNHGLTSSTPKFWHAKIWMNSYSVQTMQLDKVDESLIDAGNIYNDSMDYMIGLKDVVSISYMLKAAYIKTNNFPFIIPFDAVFNGRDEGQNLAQLLVGSYQPFLRSNAYTEQEVLDVINNFLERNDRSYRIEDLAELQSLV